MMWHAYRPELALTNENGAFIDVWGRAVTVALAVTGDGEAWIAAANTMFPTSYPPQPEWAKIMEAAR